MNTTSLHIFTHRLRCLEALQSIGLDVLGGLERLHTLIQNSKGQHGIRTNALFIRDDVKASRYVELGMKLSATTLIHETPLALEEAAKYYTNIVSLVTPANAKPSTIEKLEKLIADQKNSTLAWELKREIFRLEAKERYREALVDLAVEERVSIRRKPEIPNMANCFVAWWDAEEEKGYLLARSVFRKVKIKYEVRY